MSQFFISYSRKDFKIAEKIIKALANDDLEPWVDWKNIPKGEEFEKEIYQGIEESEIFLFLVSPDSVKSNWCNKEIEHAAINGKRILPIVVHYTDINAMHFKVSKRNLIFCRDDQDDFNEAIEVIHETIHTDYEWLKYHTKLQKKALDWKQTNDSSRLLRGKELREAEQLTRDNSKKDPEVTELQKSFRLESQKAEKRWKYGVVVTSVVVFIVVVILGISVQSESIRADEQAQIALANLLIAPAQSLFASNDSEQLLSVLLAAHSMKTYPSSGAAQILQTHILAQPVAQFQLSHNDSIRYVAYSPNGKLLISGSADGLARIWSMDTRSEISHITHEDEVSIVAFHPNGNWVASGSRDGVILIWDARTGELISRFFHEGAINDFAFSPDGTLLASGSSDGTMRVWNVATNSEVARIIYNSFVAVVDFSPDGNLVVSGGCDVFDSEAVCRLGSARVLDMKTGDEIIHVDHDGGYVSAVKFSPDGKWIASAGAPWGSNVQIWDIASGNVVFRMDTSHASGVWDIAFSSDGRWIATGGCDNRSGMKSPCFNGSARVWDTTTGEQVLMVPHKGDVQTIAFSPDGHLLASGGNDGVAHVWEVTKGQEVAQIPHKSSILSIAFSPNDNQVVTVGDTVRVWGVIDSNETARVIHYKNSGFRSPVLFSTDSQWVISDTCNKRHQGWMIPICESNSVHIWERFTGQEISRVNIEGETTAIDLSADGKIAVIGSDEGVVLVWEPSTGREIVRMLHDTSVSSVAFSADMKKVASASFDQTVRVWDAVTGQEILRMNHEGGVTSIAFSPDGNRLLSGSVDNTARYWDASTGEEIALLQHENTVTSVAISADGKWLLSGSEDRTARVWDASTGLEASRMTHDNRVKIVAFIPNSEWVVSGSEDATARVWNAVTGEEITRMVHEYGVQSIAVSADGKLIASGEMARPFTSAISVLEAESYPASAVYVWEAESGIELARMYHKLDHRSETANGIRSVTFSPDGMRIASADEEGNIYLWLYRPEDLIRYACTHVHRNLTLAEWKKYAGEDIPYQITCDPDIYPNAIIPGDVQTFLDGK